MKVSRFESGVEEELIFFHIFEFQSINLLVSPSFRRTPVGEPFYNGRLDISCRRSSSLVVLLGIDYWRVKRVWWWGDVRVVEPLQLLVGYNAHLLCPLLCLPFFFPRVLVDRHLLCRCPFTEQNSAISSINYLRTQLCLWEERRHLLLIQGRLRIPDWVEFTDRSVQFRRDGQLRRGHGDLLLGKRNFVMSLESRFILKHLFFMRRISPLLTLLANRESEVLEARRRSSARMFRVAPLL